MKTWVSALMVVAGAGLAVQACTQSLDPSGSLGAALGVNDSGIAVGWTTTGSNGPRRAVAYRDRKVVALQLLPDDVASEALSIDDQGWSAGYARSAAGVTRAVLWGSTGAISAGALQTALTPTSPGSHLVAAATALSTTAQPFLLIVGNEYQNADFSGNARAWIYHPAIVARVYLPGPPGPCVPPVCTPFVRLLVNDVAAPGWAAGSVQLDAGGTDRPVRWEAANVFQYLPLPESKTAVVAGVATSVNARGDSVGYVDLYEPGTMRRVQPRKAVLWPADSPSPVVLESGANASYAAAINDTGTIVGWVAATNSSGEETHRAAVKWRGTESPVFLEALAPSSTSEASAVSNTGKIVGTKNGRAVQFE